MGNAGDSFDGTFLDGVALVTADVYSFIIPTRGVEELNIQVRCVGTGTPVGLWSFQFSNDPVAQNEYWNEQYTRTRIGASTAAIWVPIDAPTTVHGDSLTLGGGAAQNSVVALALGNASWTRVWYDYTSGGSTASLAYVRVMGSSA
jgi:hypothetical protein